MSLLVSLLLYPATSLPLYLPCLASPTPPTAPAAQEVEAALERAYVAIDHAFLSRDVTRLSPAIIDHPVYRWMLGWRKTSKLRAYIFTVLGPEAAQDFGYLTAMQNKITHRIHGDRLLREKLAKEHRSITEITPAELIALKGKNYGVEPSLIEEPSSTVPLDSVEQYYTIRICRNKAYVSYSDYIIGRSAILLRLEGQWYVAGIF